MFNWLNLSCHQRFENLCHPTPQSNREEIIEPIFANNLIFLVVSQNLAALPVHKADLSIGTNDYKRNPRDIKVVLHPIPLLM